jgi:hypothetical protein
MKRGLSPWTTPYQSDQGEETTRIESGMEKHVSYSGGNSPEEAQQTTGETDNSRRTSTDAMAR